MATDHSNDPVRRLWQNLSESKIGLLRNLAFGGAGFSAANILILVQVGAKDVSLHVSLFASVVALPLWVSLATIYEDYIFYGRQSYSHLRSDFTINLVGSLFAISGFSLILAVAALAWHISVASAILFIFTCIISLFVIVIHGTRLRNV